MKQHTLRQSFSFSGIGLHTGKPVQMRVLPAPPDSGIRFVRTDRQDAVVPALLPYVVETQRAITLSCDGALVVTPEHLLSALYALGVDNALVELDAAELPILDGSARPYAGAIRAAGLQEQKADRTGLVIDKSFVYEDPVRGSRIVFEPAPSPVFDVTIDFGSQVLGVQRAVYDASTDYARDIAPCRTFCFLHEVEPLMKQGLIGGGSLDNALVVDEPNGYYGGRKPLFDNEPARHKLLDLLGDFSLAGRPVQGRIVAFKPGHEVDTQALKHYLASL
jgi:UDP-3-O-[3-hydroxymyristoyl] N-acetylglucosamine deacetylase/3-hydroxyacyl-[acyl-carrier-protein] dehydratase